MICFYTHTHARDFILNADAGRLFASTVQTALTKTLGQNESLLKADQLEDLLATLYGDATRTPGGDERRFKSLDDLRAFLYKRTCELARNRARSIRRRATQAGSLTVQPATDRRLGGPAPSKRDAPPERRANLLSAICDAREHAQSELEHLELQAAYEEVLTGKTPEEGGASLGVLPNHFSALSIAGVERLKLLLQAKVAKDTE